MVGRGTLNSTLNGNTITYFFHDNKYARIQWRPGVDDDKITYGPTEFVKEWHTLEKAGFKKVDAILPIPGDVNTAYFFSGAQYARIEFTPASPKEQTLGGLRSIAGNWHSLVKAGFDHVDAALVVPGRQHEAYFFCGREFCRVSFKEGTYDPDELLDGPHMISERWHQLGFNTIDAIVPNPTSEDRAYVFSGNQAALVALVPGGEVELLVGPRSVPEYWKSLRQAGFY